jgi:hypothetical protein
MNPWYIQATEYSVVIEINDIKVLYLIANSILFYQQTIFILRSIKDSLLTVEIGFTSNCSS